MEDFIIFLKNGFKYFSTEFTPKPITFIDKLEAWPSIERINPTYIIFTWLRATKVVAICRVKISRWFVKSETLISRSLAVKVSWKCLKNNPVLSLID